MISGSSPLYRLLLLSGHLLLILFGHLRAVATLAGSFDSRAVLALFPIDLLLRLLDPGAELTIQTLLVRFQYTFCLLCLVEHELELLLLGRLYVTRAVLRLVVALAVCGVHFVRHRATFEDKRRLLFWLPIHDEIAFCIPLD